MRMTISGLQAAQAANNRMIAALRPSSAMGRAVQHATVLAHRYAVMLTHVDTGALRASHRMRVAGLYGQVYIDPTARNPRTGRLARVYGPYEHARGGAHAFYHRVVDEYGMRIVSEAGRILLRELE